MATLVGLGKGALVVFESRLRSWLYDIAFRQTWIVRRLACRSQLMPLQHILEKRHHRATIPR